MRVRTVSISLKHQRQLFGFIKTKLKSAGFQLQVLCRKYKSFVNATKQKSHDFRPISKTRTNKGTLFFRKA